MKTITHEYKGFTIIIENWPAERDAWWFPKNISNARFDHPCYDSPGFKTEKDALAWAKNWIDDMLKRN